MPPLPPLLPVAVALIAGIVAADFCGSAWWILLPATIGAVALGLRHIHLALAAALLALGMMLISVRSSPLPPQVDLEREARWSGVVIEMRELDGVLSMIVTVDSVDQVDCIPFRSVITVPGTSAEVYDRDRLIFNGVLRPLRSTSFIPDEIDSRSRLADLGVVAEGFLRPADILHTAPAPGLLNDLRRSRLTVQRLITDLPLSSSTQSFLIATLTGDRQYLHPAVTNSYIAGGLAHILALSGLHVAVIMGCIMVVLIPLRLWKMHLLASLLSLGLLWCFAVLTGLTPSVVRAVLMATVWVASRHLQRRYSPLNSLAFAAILLVVADPRVIYTVGFQLSFAAVAGVVLLAPRLNPVGSPRSPFHWLGSAVAVSLAAVLATAIVSAFYFNILPVYFLAANLPVAFLLPPLLGGGLTLIIFKAFGINLPWLCQVIDALHSMVDSIAATVSALPGASLQKVWIEPREVVVYYVVLALLAAGLYFRRRLLTGVALTVSLLTLAAHYLLPPSLPASELYITASGRETSMLMREGSDLRLFTTARGLRASEVLGRDSVNFSRYMLRRGVSSFTLLSAADTLFPASRSGDYVLARGLTFLFVSSDMIDRGAYCRPPDYLVVCRGFRGDISSLVSTVKPDTVLLSGDLNRHRHDRYLAELSSASVPVRSLRSSPFILFNNY
ncbi:MAG: ComEC/Rec2 family competence protein [Bacteroides sp.]|nr:ComEC/Rec2 family competence protein [Bacteroides sp.]